MKKIIKKIFWFFNGINSYNWFYRLVALIGLLVRVSVYPLILPNWFEPIADFFISQLGLPFVWYQVLLRIILFIADTFFINPVFYFVSYATVGNNYEFKKKSWLINPLVTDDIIPCPWWGSLCYTLYYGAYMAMAGCIFKYGYWWVIAVAFSSYLLLSAIIYLISAFVTESLPYEWKLRIILHSIIFVIVVVTTCLVKYFFFN